MPINNLVMLCGRITKDLELQKTPSNISVVKFSLAINRNYNKDQVDFINCVAWKHSAEYLCKYANKGDLIQISGEIQQNNYTNRDGQNVYQLEVNCSEVTIRSQKNDNERVETKVQETKEVYKNVEKQTQQTDDSPF